jgi:UDP-N-acetylmuramoylalanine--D-glutamate ligase
MKNHGKKIGIWGYGVLGKSALAYFYKRNAPLEVMDSKELPEHERIALAQKNIPVFHQQDNLTAFLERNDLIIPSSGIDLRPYKDFSHKWLNELDFFHGHFSGTTIAITGSIGKTSTTQLLGSIIQASGINAAIGGNIGIGLFDMLEQQADMAVLELSSFQLERCSRFAPKLAILTNLYPNHLDRHATEQEYFDAKFRMFAHQGPTDTALVPLTFIDIFHTTHRITSKLAFFSTVQPTEQQLARLLPDEQLFYCTKTTINHYQKGIHTILINLKALPVLSFVENWLIICSALTLLDIDLATIEQAHDKLAVPEHRLEKVATINNIDFYNDSKSTTAQATLAAVHRLQGRPIHLFLGGLGKGVDRTPLIQQLQGLVVHIYCFGKEAATLYNACLNNRISATEHATLEEAFATCARNIHPDDQVLLSPAGTSYDLFTMYTERGNRFKELVRQLL